MNIFLEPKSYGPDSPHIDEAIVEVDNAIGELLEGLNERNFTKEVDLIVLSDHGMTSISMSRTVLVSDMLGRNIIDGTTVRNYNSGPTFDITFNDKGQIADIYNQLTTALQNNATLQDRIQGIYTKENMPQRFHYTNSDRIADITILGKVGYTLLKDSSSSYWGKFI